MSTSSESDPSIKEEQPDSSLPISLYDLTGQTSDEGESEPKDVPECSTRPLGPGVVQVRAEKKRMLQLIDDLTKENAQLRQRLDHSGRMFDKMDARIERLAEGRRMDQMVIRQNRGKQTMEATQLEEERRAHEATRARLKQVKLLLKADRARHKTQLSNAQLHLDMLCDRTQQFTDRVTDEIGEVAVQIAPDADEDDTSSSDDE